MLRRLGPMALTIGSLLSAGSASAQLPAPYAEGMSTMPAMATPASSDGAAPRSHAAPADDRLVRNASQFEPYSTFDEIRSRANQKPLWEDPEVKPSAFYKGGACADGSCGHAGHLKLGLGGLGRGLGGHGGLDGDKDTGTGPEFDSANCWTCLNFEHKTFLSYHYLEPLRTATKAGYGHAHGVTVGTEWLPWIARDDEHHFSRWGFLTAFDYNAYMGNRDVILQSELSGNVLSPSSGNGFGFLLGPTYRSDFFLFGHLRMSPSVSVGLDLNWVTMRETAPTVFPPAPITRPDPQPTFTTAEGAEVRFIEKFKYTDFCWGAYGRVVFDFPIKQKLNIGFGMDMRASKTETFVRNDDWRKYFGLILQVTGEF